MPPSTPSTPQIIDLNNTAALDLPPTPTITVPSVVVPLPPPPPTRSAVVSTKGTKDTAPTPPTQSTESILPIQQSAVAAAEFEHDQQRPDKEINNITVEFKQQLSPTTTVTVDSSGRFSNNDDYNNSKIIGGGGILLTTSTPTKLNTSMITINASDTADPSNSLASSNSVNQVTVVTSHPPVLIDNTAVASVGKDKPPLAVPSSTNEVIIVSNEMNKTRQLNESSTDEEFPSLDSLEYGPGGNKNRSSGGTIVISGGGGSSKWQQVQQTPPHRQIHQKLDDSNVFIVNNSEYESSSSSMMDTLDTSHVSVVTVGEEIYVKDSSNKIVSDSSSTTAPAAKVNGLLDDVNIIVVNKQKTSPDKRLSPDDSSVGSLDSRSQSESGSGRSIVRGAVSAAISKKALERNSDTESIATINSTDSRDPSNAVVDGEEVVMLRRSPVKVPAPAEAAAAVTAPGRSKEEIELRNLRKKTRKRTRKFEIDGVQMTTTTSQVIYGDDENGRLYDDHIIRKQELRELKLLQKQEKKQFLDLQTKEQLAREQQEKRFEQERITLERTYESDMDTLARQHKQLVDKTEQHQESDLRTMSKKVRSDQERELKMVRIYIFTNVQLFFYHLWNIIPFSSLVPRQFETRNSFAQTRNRFATERSA